MTAASRRRWWYVAGAVAVIPLGLLTKVYAGPGEAWVAGSTGGVFYVVFWVFVVLAVGPRLSPGPVSLGVLAVTCALEVLQLWHPPVLVEARSTTAGQLVLGSTFAWLDFPPYLIGAGLAWGLVRWGRVSSSSFQTMS